MGGDLNLKKSWHPSLMSNQKKVWEEEKKALEERKKIDQIRKERDEERQLQELQDLQEAAGGKKRAARVDWMYNGPSSGQTGTTEETEAFLLGKRRVDTLLQGKAKENLQKQAGEESFMAVQNANTMRDTAAKIRDDPLLAIKKQEQAAYEAMMNDPVKRRMLLKAAGKDNSEDRDRDSKRRKHHHRSRDDRDSSRRHDRHRSRRERDRDCNTDDYYSSSRQDRYRSRSRSQSSSRSPSPRRSRRSPSPRRRRSYSPDESRDKSRSQYRSRDYETKVRKVKSWHSARRESEVNARSPRRRSPSISRSDDDDKAAKLAAMQQDATELDAQRQSRLREMADRDRTESERDSAARLRNSKYGGRADFVNGFHKRAGDMSLSERVGRNGRNRMDEGESWFL